MRAEVTFFSGVIFRVDENCVVRTSCHARLAANANGFVEIDYAVGPLEHCRGGTGGNAGRVRALITTRYLMSTTCLWENADVNVLDVGASNTEGHYVFRFARSRAGMTPDATGVVDDFGPLDLLRLKH